MGSIRIAVQDGFFQASENESRTNSDWTPGLERFPPCFQALENAPHAVSVSSRVRKFHPLIFPPLEEMMLNSPTLGKKNRRIFQALENGPAGFPTLGKCPDIFCLKNRNSGAPELALDPF